MNNAKKTFIILTPGFPENEADTNCLPFLQHIVLEINKQFPELTVVILAFDYPFTTLPYRWNGNEVTCFNGWKKSRFGKLVKWWRVWQTLKRIKQDNDITGVLSFWCSDCAYLGNRFSKRNGLKHYCWLLGQDARKGNKYPMRIRPAAEGLIAISDFIQDTFHQNFGIRPKHVIPVGIDTSAFPKGIQPRDIDILGAGSLIPLKQYGQFIDIVYAVRQHFPGIKAMLCGKGPEEGKLLALIEKYGLQNNITLTKEMEHPEILKLMTRSKVFLHPSGFEGMPAVCLEALYAGCSAISFVQPMHTTIAQWHIVQTKEEMAEKLQALLQDTTSHNTAVVPFTIEGTVKQLMQLYNYNEPAIS